MKLLTRGLLIFSAVLFLFGCAAQQTTPSSQAPTGQADQKMAQPAPVAPAAPAAPAAQIDSDQDGVPDVRDKCPDTPLGASVSKYTGCWNLGHVLFNYNKADIRAAHQPMLFNIVEVLEKNPGMTIQLDGHCDNMGTVEYNMDLSARRANAIKQYLVDEGISPSRVKTKAHGFSKPIATNDTDEGRALNRRVEITPMK